MGSGAVIGTIIGGIVGSSTAIEFGTAISVGFSVGRAYDNYRAKEEMEDQFKDSSPTYSFGPVRNTKASTIPVPVLYGRNRIAGNIIYQSEPGKVIDMQVALSEGPIKSINEVKANDLDFITLFTKKHDNGWWADWESNYTKFNQLDRIEVYIELDDGGDDNTTPSADIYYKPASGSWQLHDSISGDTGYNDAEKIMINNLNQSEKYKIKVVYTGDAGGSAHIEEWKEIGSELYRYLGTATQKPDSINIEDEAFPYTAYLSTHLTATKELSGGTPTITSIVEGRKVRTWTGSEWQVQYSQNPVWCLLDLLTNSRYGLDIDDEYIDLETFKSAATYCDEEVENEEGNLEPRFKLDYVIDSRESSLDLIQDILAVFRGFLIYADGQLKLQIDQADTPVQSFSMDNIVIDSFSYSRSSRKDTPNKIIVEYIDPDNHWERTQAVATDDLNIRRNGVREKTISLLGINRFSQAARMARFYLNKAKYCTYSVEFKAGIDSIHCQAGDLITVSHDVPGWVDKEFRVVEVQESENDEMTIRAIEYQEAIYNEQGAAKQIKKDTTLPNPFTAPDSVQNLNLSIDNKQLQDGTWLTSIVVDFTPPDQISWETANIYISENDGENWDFVQKTEYSTYKIQNVAQKEYLVRVVSENRNGLTEEFDSAATESIVIQGKDVLPHDVQNFNIRQVNGDIILSWDEVDQNDIEGYRIKQGPSWQNGNFIDRMLKTNRYNLGSLQPGTWKFHIKAVDESGNESANASSASIVKFDSQVRNVVESFHDDYTTGSHTDTRAYYDVADDKYLLATDRKAGKRTWDSLDVTTWEELAEKTGGSWYLPCEKEGTYTSPQFDIGMIKQARVFIDYEQLLRGKTATWDDYEGMTWEELVNSTGAKVWLDLVDSGELNVILHYSKDGTDWQQMENFLAADIEARYFQVEIRFSNKTEWNQLVLNEYNLVVDMPDINEDGTVVVDGSKTIDFDYDFHSIKSIQLTIMEDQELNARVSSYGTDSFTIKVTDNNGNPATTEISWKATGY